MAYDPNNRMGMAPGVTDGRGMGRLVSERGADFDPRMVMEMLRRRMGGGGGVSADGGGFGFGGFGGGFRPPMGPPRTGFDRPTGRIERGAWNDPNMMRGRGPMGPPGPPMGMPKPGFRPPVLYGGDPAQLKPAMVNPRQPVNKMPMGMFKQPMKNTVGSVLGGGKPGGTQSSWF